MATVIRSLGITGISGYPLMVEVVVNLSPSDIKKQGAYLDLPMLIWRLMERQMRMSLAHGGKKLPGWVGQQADRPPHIIHDEHSLLRRPGCTPQTWGTDTSQSVEWSPDAVSRCSGPQ